MPELPEVERGRKLAERVALGRVIRKVWCAKDELVFEGATPAKMRRALVGRKVFAVCRLELDQRPWPLFHFGMTGGFHVPAPGSSALELVSSPKKPDTDWPPRFAKIHLFFDDGGGELVMTNKRRLGRIRLREDPENEPPISKLGFDPLIDLPSPASFVGGVLSRKAAVKAVLLDQSFAAGVGNWIADEVLYQAKLDPRKRANSLSVAEAKRVRTCLKRIIEKAVSVDADKKRFPRTWLFHHRWGKNAEAKTARGEAIEHITLAGRTTAWVPEVQR